jgi:hypothetical protein
LRGEAGPPSKMLEICWRFAGDMERCNQCHLDRSSLPVSLVPNMQPRNVLDSRPARGCGNLIGKVWLSGRITRKLPSAVHIHLAALAVPRKAESGGAEYLGAVKYLRTGRQRDNSPTLCYTTFAFASPGDSRPGHTPKWQSMRTCIARYVHMMLHGEKLAILTAGTARNERCISARYRKQQLLSTHR